MFHLKSFGLSDIGLSRTNNEDVWAAFPEVGFFALADGMGGHLGGEIAAKETLDFLERFVREMQTGDPMEQIIEMRDGIEKANRKIFQMGLRSKHLRGMGTTLCCLLWKNSSIVYAHVGDSRIYRMRGKKIEQLTQDHSFLARLLKVQKRTNETPYPYKNVLTRAIGFPGKANPEISVATHEIGDLYVLCSDGLSDVLSLSEIEQTILEHPTLSIAAEKLIDLAKIKGSPDNVTLLLVQSEHAENLPRQQCDDRTRPEGLQGDACRAERPSLEPL